MIVKAGMARLREFHGVKIEVLAVGQSSMVSKMLYGEGDSVPFHSHESEQCGYVLSGRYRLRFGGFDELIGAGDSYAIPGNIEHSLEVLEPGEVLDVFTPIREEYL